LEVLFGKVSDRLRHSLMIGSNEKDAKCV